jgi:hypothetical protein
MNVVSVMSFSIILNETYLKPPIIWRDTAIINLCRFSFTLAATLAGFQP